MKIDDDGRHKRDSDTEHSQKVSGPWSSCSWRTIAILCQVQDDHEIDLANVAWKEQRERGGKGNVELCVPGDRENYFRNMDKRYVEGGGGGGGVGGGN